MRKRFQVACRLAVPVAVLLAAVRCIALPQVLASNISAWSWGLLLATAAVLLGVLCLGLGKPLPAPVLRGRSLWVTAVGALITGATMAVVALWSLWMLQKDGAGLSAPTTSMVAEINRSFLYADIITGLLGGAYFLILAVTWLQNGRSSRGKWRLLALAPVVWCWVRIIRFELSYTSSLNLHRSAYELLMLVFETVFLFWFARFASGEGETPPRLFTGVALGAGILAGMACFTRVGMLVLQNRVAFEACALTVAADAGLCVLAFAMAFARAFATPADLNEPDEAELAFSIQQAVMKDLEQPEKPSDEEPFYEVPAWRVDQLFPEEK